MDDKKQQGYLRLSDGGKDDSGSASPSRNRKRPKFGMGGRYGGGIEEVD